MTSIIVAVFLRLQPNSQALLQSQAAAGPNRNVASAGIKDLWASGRKSGLWKAGCPELSEAKNC